MYLILCKLWPYLAGFLIGWLLSGLFARRLKYREPPEEKIIEKEIKVEKIVDNPEHLSLISNLKKENETITGLRSRITELENRKPEVVENKVEIEKLVDNPQHLNKINELEGELNIWKRGPAIDLPAAKLAGISINKEDDFTAIEGIGPKINDLIHADGIHTFKQLSETEIPHIQKILDGAGANFQMANPGTWPDQAHLAASNRWPALRALQDILDGGVYPDHNTSSERGEADRTSSNNSEYLKKINELENELESYRAANVQKSFLMESVTDSDSAKAAGFKIRQKDGKDDFTIVEGIGPKINDLIHDAGIHFYGELAQTQVAHLQKILDDAGPNFQLAEPDTWPAQADLAAKNEWEALKKWQDELDGGKA